MISSAPDQPATPTKPAQFTARSPLFKRGAIVLVLLMLAGLGLVANTYWVDVLCTAAIFAIVAMGYNMLAGYTGQISVGHAGFFAIGAYTAGLLEARLGLPLWISLPAAALVSTLVSIVLAVPAVRLTGPYITIATLGFGIITGKVALNLDFLGGNTGLQVPDPTLGFYTFQIDSGGNDYFVFVLLVAALCYWAANNLLTSSTGRAFIALRDAPIAAQSMGIAIARYKVLAFALSAAYAGVGGALFINFTKHLSPDDFTIFLSIRFLSMVVIGGLGTVWGSLIGATVLTLVESSLQVILPLLEDILKNVSAGNASVLASPIYGLIIILVMLFLPDGIYGGLCKLAGSGNRKKAISISGWPEAGATHRDSLAAPEKRNRR